jgi:hypothetical protein
MADDRILHIRMKRVAYDYHKETTMNKMKRSASIIIFICMLSVSAAAADFDGSQPLICAFIDIVECGTGGKCQPVSAEDAGIPQFIKINFKEKKIRGTRTSESKRSTTIKNSEHVDGKLILQGAEDGVEGVRDGYGWSLAIAEDSGKMVLTASGDEVGFVVFGACTLP